MEYSERTVSEEKMKLKLEDDEERHLERKKRTKNYAKTPLVGLLPIA